MYERAKYHPHQTQGMKDAMEIFAPWLKKYDEEKSNLPREEFKKEWEQRKLLASSVANLHARSK